VHGSRLAQAQAHQVGPRQTVVFENWSFFVFAVPMKNNSVQTHRIDRPGGRLAHVLIRFAQVLAQVQANNMASLCSFR
jgi:hypothetical protein